MGEGWDRLVDSFKPAAGDLAGTLGDTLGGALGAALPFLGERVGNFFSEATGTNTGSDDIGAQLGEVANNAGFLKSAFVGLAGLFSIMKGQSMTGRVGWFASLLLAGFIVLNSTNLGSALDNGQQGEPQFAKLTALVPEATNE